MIVIRNCRLVNALTEGYDGSTADVYVKGNKIAQIQAAGTPYEADEPLTVIDGTGKTLIPGLIEMHSHL